MIIKIRTFKDNLTLRNISKKEDQSICGEIYRGWWIEDGITKISIVEIEVPPVGTVSLIAEADCSLLLPDIIKKEGVQKAIQLICWMKDGNKRVIVFQGEAFLLNDEGRTIERLVT